MADPFVRATVDSLAAPWKGSIKIGPFGSQLKREDMVERGRKVYGQENVIAVDWSAGNRRVSQAKFNALRSCELHPGDVVLSMMGTIGKCAVFPTNAEPGLMDSHLLRIQPNLELVTREYLATVLQSENVVGRQVSAMSHGSIMAGLSSSIVRRFTVPLPPLNEQPVLSAILDTLDTAIRQTEAIIAKLKHVKQGLLHDLLTRGMDANGELRPSQAQAPHLYKSSLLGWIPKEWDVQPLEGLVASGSPITYGVVQPGPDSDDGVPFVRGGDIFGGKILVDQLRTISQHVSDAYRRTQLRGGELLMSLVGYPGEVGLVPETLAGANIARQAALVRLPDAALAAYVMHYLSSVAGKRQVLGQSLGSAQQVVNLGDLRRVVVPLPAAAEQMEISSRVNAILQRLRREAVGVAKLTETKSGLMDDLLTGRVRVTPLLEAAARP